MGEMEEFSHTAPRPSDGAKVTRLMFWFSAVAVFILSLVVVEAWQDHQTNKEQEIIDCLHTVQLREDHRAMWLDVFELVGETPEIDFLRERLNSRLAQLDPTACPDLVPLAG